MNPVTHALAGWCLANVAPLDEGRDRMLVTLGCILPDLDGLGMVVGLFRNGTEDAAELFSRYHHVMSHNGLACLVLALLCFALARRRRTTTLFFVVAFHLHLLMDVAGSRGPDGHQWPIPYFAPFSPSPAWTWDGQWELASWQNGLITVVLMVFTARFARRRGFSFLEAIWPRADRELVETIRRRFPLVEASAIAADDDGEDLGEDHGDEHGTEHGDEAQDPLPK